MPAGWVAAAVAVAGVASAVVQSDSARKAAHAQEHAADRASQTELDMFHETEANLDPFREGGTNALGALQSQLGIGPGGRFNPNSPLLRSFSMQDFQKSPGYQFQLEQGIGAARNGASASGGVLSGNTLRELTRYGTGLANQDYWNQYNAFTQHQGSVYDRLYNQAAMGENAAARIGTFGANTASEVGSNQIGAGNAQAANYIAQGNAWAQGFNSLAQAASIYGGGAGGGGASNLAFSPQEMDSFNSSFGGNNYQGQFQGGPNAQYSFSDRRLKEDIEEVGKLKNGLKVYLYRYKGARRKHLGLMADEVAAVKPGAVKNHLTGYKMVNYEKAAA